MACCFFKTTCSLTTAVVGRLSRDPWYIISGLVQCHSFGCDERLCNFQVQNFAGKWNNERHHLRWLYGQSNLPLPHTPRIHSLRQKECLSLLTIPRHVHTEYTHGIFHVDHTHSSSPLRSENYTPRSHSHEQSFLGCLPSYGLTTAAMGVQRAYSSKLRAEFTAIQFVLNHGVSMCYVAKRTNHTRMR
jgi:hypothetical protein